MRRFVTPRQSPRRIPRRSPGQWVHAWAAAPQLTEPANLPPAPFAGEGPVLAGSTLRQTVQISLGGRRIRLRLSNAFGGAPLPVTSVAVAHPAGGLAGTSAVEPGTFRPVTFSGRPGAAIAPGAQVVSDPLDFAVAAGSSITVTMYLAEGQASHAITSHPGARTTSHLLLGNHVAAVDLPGAAVTDHWYFLSGVETWCGPSAAAVVMLGDSLTDGRGSTTNLNDRWPDQLFRRLQHDRRTASVAVCNQAAGGNRVLADGLGPAALARLDRDVLGCSGVRWLIVFEGVNDLGTAEATLPAQRQVVEDLLSAYHQIIIRAQAHGIRVYGATLTPFGGNAPYDDAGGLRERSRQAVNDWIRTSGRFDRVIDFDRALRDQRDSRRLREAFDVGDHLHLNPAGYRALAQAVPAGLFLRPPRVR